MTPPGGFPPTPVVAQEKEAGSVSPRFGHKRPQCGRFFIHRSGVGLASVNGLLGSVFEKTPLLQRKQRGRTLFITIFGG